MRITRSARKETIMHYRTAFQCPSTGETVIANYAFGRVTMTPDNDAEMLETFQYCLRNTNKRCKTFAEADKYLISVAEGQTCGFDY